ncbi:hypothetical protein ANANG_G00162420 [Anguilla anguilla]|uniref:Uncharacterized protein n=1 Tax=Anguilla anguilla TaxID=7936 RepID=A0A9D3MBI5_ANGAN|nr:hypothetical protein ANANG_G00162420 [Anguilla anguilla]
MSRLSVSKSESWSRSFKENTNRQNPQLTASLQRLKIAPFVCLLFFICQKIGTGNVQNIQMKNLTGTGWILLVVPSRLNSSTFSYQNACLGHRSHTVWQNNFPAFYAQSNNEK